jgi:hypothetical protein
MPALKRFVNTRRLVLPVGCIIYSFLVIAFALPHQEG